MTGNDHFVDIHCHLLPGIDDGAKSWEESLSMAAMAVADGTSAVVATPHQLGHFAENDGDSIRGLVARLRDLLSENGIPLEVLAGADVRIEPDLISKIQSGSVLTLADRGRYVLLELPHEMYLPLDNFLDQLRAAGLVGVLSHPERNLGILARPQLVTSLVEAGCLMQITAGSLAGVFGPEVRFFAESLVAGGLAHFIATDAHGPRTRRPLMRRAFDRACELVGAKAAHEMCCLNPAYVVTDRQIVPGRRPSTARRKPGWFRWRKAG